MFLLNATLKGLYLVAQGLVEENASIFAIFHIRWGFFSIRRHIFNLKEIQAHIKLYHISWRVFFIKNLSTLLIQIKDKFILGIHFYNVWWKLSLNWPKKIYVYQYFSKSEHLTCYFLMNFFFMKSFIHFDGASIMSAKVNYSVVFFSFELFIFYFFLLILSAER